MVACSLYLADRIFHVPWAHELAFFQVNGPLGERRSPQDRRLTTQVRWHLHHVAHLARCSGPRRIGKIGNNGNTKFIPNVGQNTQAIVHAQAVVAVRRRAAIFVVARLVNPRNAELLADFANGFGHHKGVFTALDRTGAANKSQRQFVANFDFVDLAVANFDYFVNHEKHPV